MIDHFFFEREDYDVITPIESIKVMIWANNCIMFFISTEGKKGEIGLVGINIDQYFEMQKDIEKYHEAHTDTDPSTN